MGDVLIPIVVGIVGLIIGGVIGFFVRRYLVDSRIKSVESQAREMLEKADASRKEIEVQAKEEMLKEKNVYGELYSDQQIDICYDAIFDAEYLRCRIIELLRVKPRSVKQLAPLLGVNPSEILPQIALLLLNIANIKNDFSFR